MTSVAAREILNAPRLLPHHRCYTLISLRCWGGTAYFEGGSATPCPPSRHAPAYKAVKTDFFYNACVPILLQATSDLLIYHTPQATCININYYISSEAVQLSGR